MHIARAGLLIAAAITALGAAASPRWSQPEGAPAPALANHPVAGMVGTWRGTVRSLGRDGAWHTAQGVERARWTLSGSAILVEGYGFVEDAETGKRTIGHDAVGLIEFDEADKSVRFYARRAGSDFERHILEVDRESGVMRWRPTAPAGAEIRFTVSLSDTRWHEVGEMSSNGGDTWTKFLEADLARVKE